MRFDDKDIADSSQVEDRRGIRGGHIAVGGGLGVVGTLIYLAVRVLGGDASVSSDDTPPPPTVPPAGQATTTGASLSGSCEGVRSQTDPAKFVVCVETNVQDFWAKELPRMGATYRPAKLVLFTERTSNGCGIASAASGPFYCPSDGKVFLDLGFFQELSVRFHAQGGDFAQAYVVAHEYGHRVQDVLGVAERAHDARLSRASANAASVGIELQADCYAGVWGHSAYENGKVADDEIAQAIDAAAAVGDDRIQKEMRGTVRPDTFTHGSSAERVK